MIIWVVVVPKIATFFIQSWECGKLLQRQLIRNGKLDEETYAGEVNRLRRTWMEGDRFCYERYFSFFQDAFWKRHQTVTNHFNLHIPKAGGTSLCAMAKERWDNLTKWNCWDQDFFYPIWCCGTFQDRERVSCDAPNNISSFPDFVMNENYLDHPLCLKNRIYSIVLRDPVERAMSHEKHLRERLVTPPEKRVSRSGLNKQEFEEAKKRKAIARARLKLVRNNYITWSLSSGSHNLKRRDDREATDDEQSIITWIPTLLDLEHAKDTLSRFDFLLEFSRNARCDEAMLELMGFEEGKVVPHKNTGAARLKVKKENSSTWSIKQFKEHNQLDMELLQSARKWMESDCEFFASLLAQKQ